MKGMIRVVQVLLCLVLAVPLIGGIWLRGAGVTRTNTAPQVLGQLVYLQQEETMSPEIKAGDLVLGKPREQYLPGEAVLAADGARVRALRVVGAVGEQLILRGDGEDSQAETLFEPEQVLGRVETVLAGAGAVVGFVASPAGMILFGALLALVLLLPAILRPRAPRTAGRHGR